MRLVCCCRLSSRLNDALHVVHVRVFVTYVANMHDSVLYEACCDDFQVATCLSSCSSLPDALSAQFYLLFRPRS